MTVIIQEAEEALEDIVNVHVVKDETKPRRRYLRTTLKSYTVDNVNIPAVMVAPYNPNRSHAHIVTNDTNIVITQDNPSNSVATSAAATPPAGASVHCSTMGNGFPGIIVHGPDPIWVQSISGLGATRVSVMQHVWCYHE